VREVRFEPETHVIGGPLTVRIAQMRPDALTHALRYSSRSAAGSTPVKQPQNVVSQPVTSGKGVGRGISAPAATSSIMRRFSYHSI
jgi:hypothetical protein